MSYPPYAVPTDCPKCAVYPEMWVPYFAPDREERVTFDAGATYTDPAEPERIHWHHTCGFILTTLTADTAP